MLKLVNADKLPCETPEACLPDEYLVRFEARAAGITVASARELWLWFVALLVCPGCLTHLIVLRFGDAFFKHLRTLTPSLGIFIFSELERRKGGRSL